MPCIGTQGWGIPMQGALIDQRKSNLAVRQKAICPKLLTPAKKSPPEGDQRAGFNQDTASGERRRLSLNPSIGFAGNNPPGFEI
jgi:hypothetical protein